MRIKDKYGVNKLLIEHVNLTSSLSRHSICHVMLEFLKSHLGIVHSYIALLQPDKNEFFLCAIGQYEESVFQGEDNLQAKNTVLSELATCRKPVYRPDIADVASGYLVDTLLIEAGIRSDFNVPLWLEDRCLGMLNVASNQLDGFVKEAREFILLLAPNLTHSLEKATLYESLHTREQELRSLVEISPVGIFKTDSKGDCIYVNDRWRQLAGITADEAMGQGWVSALHYEDKERVEREWYDAAREDYAFKSEYRFCRPDGGITWLLGQSVVQYDAEGKIIGYIGTVTDITDLKLAQEKLRQSVVYVDNAADAILITDENNTIIEVNRAYTEITGYTRDEVLGKNPSFLRSEKHDRDFYDDIWDNVIKQGVWRGEVWNRRKNGEIFPAWETISALHDPKDKISNFISVFSDISSINRSQENLDFLAHHDPLTKLPNRILFNDRLDHALQRALRDNKKVGIVFLDLDRFKNINDSLGHHAGDLILQMAAERIKTTLREEDTVARLGGDEFVIIVEEIDQPQDVAVIAEQLIEAFNESFLINGKTLHLSVSMGISLYPDDGEISETLMRNADTAMYRAKEEGRNGYQFFTSSLTLEAFERLTMESAFRNGLENGEFILHYQPQVSLQSGQILGAEALVRWQHLSLGLISPDKFIPLAEESGLILQLGRWVLQTACAQMQDWLKRGLNLERITVNVSGVQFQRNGIFESVADVLRETGLQPARLELEITESTIMQRMDMIIDVLDKLSQLGITIAIDDFGTGYFSLSHLKRLPVNKLKIDKSFVRDIPQDANDVAITRAVNALAQSLQIGFVAEGIETEQQRTFLKQLGCSEMQGYLYSRPVPADEFAAMIPRS